MCLPFNHGAPPPLFAGTPRTTIDSALIRVELENGLVGWGESYAPDPAALVSFFKSRIAPLATGVGATEADAVARMERVLHNMGRSGILLHALSGFDIALHDLRAKIEGVPLHQLLGSAHRTRIPGYASLLQYYGDTELIASNVERALAQGFTAIKLHEKTVDACRAARSAMTVGQELMLDTNCAWSEGQAAVMLPQLAEFNLLWVEEPIWPPEDARTLGRIRAMTRIPIAAGENASSVMELEACVNQGIIDVAQPSAIKSGGVSALMRIAKACEQASAKFSPQSAFFGPGLLATLHVLAVQPREVAVERLFCTLAKTPFSETVPLVDASFTLTDQPGLGADPSPDLLSFLGH
jgi:L-alanine-DL-glutamate epimerase-like enolase superfamily enzyme